MNKSELKSLIKESIREVLNETSLKEGNVLDTLTSNVAKAAYRMIAKNINLRSDVKTEVENAIKAANKANPGEMISANDARRLLTYGWSVKNSLDMMER